MMKNLNTIKAEPVIEAAGRWVIEDQFVYQSKSRMVHTWSQPGEIGNLYKEWQLSLTYVDEMQEVDPLGFTYLVPQEKTYVPLVQLSHAFDSTDMIETQALVEMCPDYDLNENMTFAEAGVCVNVFGKIILVPDGEYLADREDLRQVFIDGGWPVDILQEYQSQDVWPEEDSTVMPDLQMGLDCTCAVHAVVEDDAVMAMTRHVSQRRIFAHEMGLPVGTCYLSYSCYEAYQRRGGVYQSIQQLSDRYSTVGLFAVWRKLFSYFSTIFPTEIWQEILDRCDLPFERIPPFTRLQNATAYCEFFAPSIPCVRDTPTLYITRNGKAFTYLLVTAHPLRYAIMLTRETSRPFIQIMIMQQAGFAYQVSRNATGPVTLYLVGHGVSTMYHVGSQTTIANVPWQTVVKGDVFDYLLSPPPRQKHLEAYIQGAHLSFELRRHSFLFSHCPVKYIRTKGESVAEPQIMVWQKRLGRKGIFLTRREIEQVLVQQGYRPYCTVGATFRKRVSESCFLKTTGESYVDEWERADIDGSSVYENSLFEEGYTFVDPGKTLVASQEKD